MIIGIITNALYAKFATEVKQIEEQVQLKQIMSDSNYSYMGTINDLLGIDSEYNEKLIIQEWKLVYVSDEVSSQEVTWLKKLGIEQSSEYYTVEFDTGIDLAIASQTIKSGNLVKKPTNPTKSGYEFAGWYYSEQTGTEENPIYTEYEFDFDTSPTNNYSLYAKYCGEAIMMARNNNSAFWQEDIRTNLTNITFTKDSSLIPENPEQTWDIRADKTNGGMITAYLVDSENLIVYSPFTIYGNSYAANYFQDFHKLTSISFDNFNTSKITNMINMFLGCALLTNIDLTNFDTSKVTNMSGMFFNCSQLKNINLSTFNTSEVLNMSQMFFQCKKLENINFSAIDTSKVLNMEQMFLRCTNLSNIDVSSFNTKNLKNIKNMFLECTNLTELNLKNWKVSNLENITSNTNMFVGIPKATYIYVDDIDMKNWILNLRSDLENIHVNEI